MCFLPPQISCFVIAHGQQAPSVPPSYRENGRKICCQSARNQPALRMMNSLSCVFILVRRGAIAQPSLKVSADCVTDRIWEKPLDAYRHGTALVSTIRGFLIIPWGILSAIFGLSQVRPSASFDFRAHRILFSCTAYTYWRRNISLKTPYTYKLQVARRDQASNGLTCTLSLGGNFKCSTSA